jgi:hypothetical protein
MKNIRKHTSLLVSVAVLLGTMFLAVPRLVAQQDGPPSTGDADDNFNPPPCDFNDAFYTANGINVTQLDSTNGQRFGLFRQFGPPARNPRQANWVLDSNCATKDPTRNNVRILATTGGYIDDGSGDANAFINIMAFLTDQTFFVPAAQSGGTGNARGIAMEDIVSNFEGYPAVKQKLVSGVIAPTPCGSMFDTNIPANSPCFPVSSIATPNLRQDWRFATNRNAIDGSDNNDPLGVITGSVVNSPFGYFCDDLLGMWVLTYFWYTHHAVGNPANSHEKPDPVCNAMLTQLASMHGKSLDGTPNIITANELNFLEGKDVGAQPLGPNFPNPPVFSDGEGCTAEGQLDTGGADAPGAAWLICPAIPDPRAGAITQDAFLDSVRYSNGAPLDSRFNVNFACLKVVGAFCSEVNLTPSQSSKVSSVAASD